MRGSSYNPSIAKAIQCNSGTGVPNNGVTGEQGAGPYHSILTEVASFGTFGIGNDPTIPVELMSFDVKKGQKAALLTWTTASEKDNAYFNIEHSTSGIDFQTIGQVKGNGTTTTATTYNFEHQTPSVFINYYRLKQVDTDGKTTLSPRPFGRIRQVRINHQNDFGNRNA